ncbi:MAG: transcriptional regulator [Chloroflexi bacterium]|nr:MAG: transcriptional regulator [Chloroflexota bacterium]
MGAVPAMVIADPAPLGLAAFGITILCLSAVYSGWIGAAATTGVLALAIPLGGVALGLAGMWAFRRGTTFVATAFTSYGAFWISFYLLVNFYLGGISAAGGAGVASQFLGLYLLAWGIFTSYMLLASLSSGRAMTLVFVLLTLTFFMLAAGEWANPAIGSRGETLHHIGGYLGIATAVAMLYGSFAEVTNANFKRVILPTF